MGESLVSKNRLLKQAGNYQASPDFYRNERVGRQEILRTLRFLRPLWLVDTAEG
jgi:hypothetical protein